MPTLADRLSHAPVPAAATRRRSPARHLFATLLLFLLGVGVCAAQDDAPAPAATIAASPRPDAADVAAYVGGVVDAYRRRFGIAGVTVAVVDAQGPLLLQGYGNAGFEPRRDVDARRTLFRIGSVSKTFTYLLALRLIDAGRLDLDAPVNGYLPADLKLADDGFRPVLLRHLLTHTAGYEDSAFGHLIVDKPENVLSLHDYLLRHRPARVREPGLHAVYSNYGLGLLGAVLAQVEGMPFEQLAERELFAPMGMTATSFREPLDGADPRHAAALPDGVGRSDGFVRSGGSYQRQGFEHIAQVAPAGAVSSTAEDMARYLRMLVNRGVLDGRRIVTESAFARLEGDPLFRTAPAASGFAYGFFRREYGSVHSLEHGGATLFFHSNLVAVPELGFGVFVSTNTASGARLAAELPNLLLQRYFANARPAPLPQAPRDAATDASAYAGDYLGERRNYRTFEKVLTASTATIAATADGDLVLTAGDETTRWTPERSDVFRAAEGPGRLVFLRDAQGRVSGYVAPQGHDVYDRAGPFDSPTTLALLLGLASLVAVGVLAGAWLRRRRGVPRNASARWLCTTAAAWLAFALLFGAAFAQLAGMGNAAVYAYPTPLLRVALWLALPALLLTLLSATLLWPVWRTREFGVWRKSRHTLAVLVFALAGVSVWVWNALGWKL